MKQSKPPVHAQPAAPRRRHGQTASYRPRSLVSARAIRRKYLPRPLTLVLHHHASSSVLSPGLRPPNDLDLIGPIPLTAFRILDIHEHVLAAVLKTEHARLSDHGAVVYAIPEYIHIYFEHTCGVCRSFHRVSESKRDAPSTEGGGGGGYFTKRSALSSLEAPTLNKNPIFSTHL